MALLLGVASISFTKTWSPYTAVFESPSRFLLKGYSILRCCLFVCVICVLMVIFLWFFRLWTSLESAARDWVSVNSTSFCALDELFATLTRDGVTFICCVLRVPQWCSSLLCWILLICDGLSLLGEVFLDGKTCCAWHYFGFF